MLKRLLFIFFLGSVAPLTRAQLLESFVHTGEIGFGFGVSHYFGDLNPDGRIKRPKPAVGIFFRKQVSNYIGIRISGEYAFLGYSDIYSENPVQRRRNLSFNTNVWELVVSGDFSFFRF